MGDKQNFIKVPVDLFREFISAMASIKALEKYIQGTKYCVDRKAIAEICGFELREDDD